MDNIVDYLVVGFFIISFLSSIFKKKKPKNSSADIEGPAQKSKLERSRKAKNPFDEFFNQIEKKVIEATETNEVNNQSEVDEYYQAALKNSEEAEVNIKSREFKEPIPLESLPKTENVIAIKSYADSVKLNKTRHENKKANELKKKLRTTSSIRDYILLNEILGKPKALQR